MPHTPDIYPVIPCLHFVGFRGEEYWSAVRIWGKPGMIHQRWDRRAQQDVHPNDKVVFATGESHQPISEYNGPDLIEKM